MTRYENPRKVKFIILVCALALVLINVLTAKSNNTDNTKEAEQEEITLLENYYSKLIEQNNKMNQPGKDLLIKVINRNYIMIAKGNENDANIKHLISKSDFLTQIDGKRYYRLSFK
jgi:hypothetical protein